VIVDLDVDFSTNINDSFITSIVPIMLRNLMANNNSFELDGVSYPVAIDMVFEREVPHMNGSLISVDNVTACTHIFFGFSLSTASILPGKMRNAENLRRVFCGMSMRNRVSISG